MSLVAELINNLENITLKEDLQERLDLVQHKIKFMDIVPVCFLDTLGQANLQLSEALLLAGGEVFLNPADAAYVIYFEDSKNLEHLMRNAPVTLQADWQAVKFNRICLLADDYDLNKAGDLISLIEDLAEMIHPGSFIFGFEGDKWIRFTA